MEIQREVHGDDDGLLCGPDEIVYADSTVPNDPSYILQYQHPLVNMPQAWDVTTGDRSLVVALIDSGIDYSHPDLANNIWTNPGEIPNDGNNNRGVAGVAWKLSVVPLRFLNEKGQGYLSNALEAIDYAILMNIRMSVNSWSCTGCSVPTLETAVQRAGQAGHLFITSAGNKKNNNDATPTIPCGFNLDNIICVAATDANDVLLTNSNYGATTVDLAAPGGSIYSTKPSNTYAYMSGTSMAVPMVAGAAALMFVARPLATAAQIKWILVTTELASILNTVESVAGLQGKCVTGGRLDVAAALSDITTCEQAAYDACAALDNGSWCQFGVTVSTCQGAFSLQCPCGQNRRALGYPEREADLHV
ncbi:Thermophilic serine proteinase precursor, putative [Perkinsus marinus ATCC 50983]|uniref:subtilisin n=1 Tax=Perkinsus marinus (strain ATCC 50983 / TXsc) TaxID=423536 RepID=C5KSZ7_PERM5|nr:Thermophilic serine proteinase precursor, putative [Perkinsus marinus ATCC 50983]EER12347.1 Thermophilic serine proteinase precursor, putative [Perkinsus marinus ATCC 50983]|eukprot:XP_002780552.1 Thermophilic serine proteinase precursor, putative [Perkinsus marinus ATCC 50983]